MAQDRQKQENARWRAGYAPVLVLEAVRRESAKPGTPDQRLDAESVLPQYDSRLIGPRRFASTASPPSHGVGRSMTCSDHLELAAIEPRRSAAKTAGGQPRQPPVAEELAADAIDVLLDA